MTAICHRCGIPKAAPNQRCTAVSCGCVPLSDDELALAFMLTDQYLSKEKLEEASRLIKDGQRIELPPHIKTAVLAAIQSAQISRSGAGQNRGIGIRGWCVLACIATILIVVLYPWANYQRAVSQDKVSSYENFINRFPSSEYADAAEERIRILREPEVWSQAQETDHIDAFREYLRNYPDGKHINKAKARVVEIADSQWDLISLSRSEVEIRNFLKRYPETSKTATAEARIQELFNDWAWIREQDSLEHYKRFVTRFPNHPERRWMEKRIIDLEVNEIAAGEHGEMPRAQLLSYGGSVVELEVENQTGYELSVRYSGPDSRKLVIPKGASQTVSLPPGEYKIAASVTAANVRNYYGTDTMRGGQYSSSFYIQQEYGGSYKKKLK